MHFIIYETTNKVNGKKYRGAHVTSSLDDGYIGSGKLLKKAIAKYGFDSFERSILQECSSVEEMFKAEASYVSPEWVEDLNTYNLKVGGEGGWDYINKNSLRWDEEKKRIHSIEMKKKRQLGEWGPNGPSYGFKGKTHDSSTKKKISVNNGMNLDQSQINIRIDQWNSLPDVRGKVSKISNLWGISHTQVRRFVDKYLGVA